MDINGVLLNTAYFPPIQYYSKIIRYNKIILEQYENYGKQSYRNRCDIYGANGILTLSVPVLEGARKKILTKDVRIEYVSNWQKIHFKSIESAYRRSPYYEYYIDEIEPLFNRQFSYLLDLNNSILEVINGILDIDPKIKMSENYYSKPINLIDWREGLHPKKSKKIEDLEFISREYTQVFSNKAGFASNLSIIDLIFNKGPEAYTYLETTFNM